MTPERWRQITAVFHAALARDPASRDVFLDEACVGDGAKRAEIDRLLAAHDEAGPFGETPVHATPSTPSVHLGPAAFPENSPAADSPTGLGRRHPFLVVVWFNAAASIAAFGYAGWLLIMSGGISTTYGWTETRQGGGWYVASVQPGGPAAGQLQRGDRLLSVNGVPPIGPSGTFFQRRSLSVGDAYKLTIERENEPHERSLMVAAGPNEPARRLTFYLVSLVWCAVGLFIGFARPEQTLARLACGAAVATGLVFLQVGVIRSGPIWQPLHVVLGFHFFARFPADRPSNGILRWALVLSYVAGGVVAAVGMWMHGLVLALGISAVAEFASRYSLVVGLRDPLLMFYPVAVVGMVLALPRNYRLLTDEDSRRRVRWVVYGSGVGLALQVWWAAVNLYEQTVGPAPVPRFDLTATAFTVAIPISVAYGVVKHRMFDIKVVVRRGVQYLLARRALQTAVALPVIALAVTVVLHRNLTIAELVTETGAYLYWLGAAGLILRFRRPIQLWLDQRFFREEHDREQLLLGLLDEVGKVDSIGELSRLVSDQLASALHPSCAYIWYRDPHELATASSSDPLLTPLDVPSSDRWLAWLEDRGEATGLPEPADAGLSPDDVRWFATRGINLIVPITDSDDRLVGALLLGEKKSEQPYTASDRRLLGALAKQAAVVRENVRLRARVGEEVRIRHDVLARLDGRLPDLLKECPACGACFDGAVDRCQHDEQPLVLSLPVARTIEGKYRLDRLIGKGGMGAVYEARDLRLDRSVAVKIMLGRAFGQQAALRRFHREARAAARLNHPNIVGVYDFGALEGEGAYFVMERVHGVTLRAELDRRGAIGPTAAAEWFEQLLDGIAAAHGQGIVHRDLKPENVIGERLETGSLAVKILDLGLAKFHGREAVGTGTITAEGVVMGTLGYMSPEQLLGRDVDHRTDIFAVGVMLIETLTGHRPYRGDTPAEFSRALQQPRHGLPGTSPQARALDDLVQRCLAVDPRDRFASASALRTELSPLLRRCPPWIRSEFSELSNWPTKDP